MDTMCACSALIGDAKRNICVFRCWSQWLGNGEGFIQTLDVLLALVRVQGRRLSSFLFRIYGRRSKLAMGSMTSRCLAWSKSLWWLLYPKQSLTSAERSENWIRKTVEKTVPLRFPRSVKNQWLPNQIWVVEVGEAVQRKLGFVL